MIWSSSKPAVRPPRDIDEMIAAEWALEELLEPLPESGAAVADPAEQDALVEAIAIANAEREQAEAAERERLIAEAYERGVADGRQEGREIESARLAEAVRAAETALDELRSGEVRWTGVIEENLCAVAVGVARQILSREPHDVAATAELARRALAEFPIDQPLAIRVNPADLAQLSVARGPDGEPISIAPGREARWVADPNIQSGGCLVEGRDRIIDGRVDAALERLYRRLSGNHA